MEIKGYFENPAQAELAKNFFISFHDTLFIKEKISDSDAIVLSAFMLANKNKTNKLQRKEVEDLFCTFGKKKDNFRKRLADEIKSSSAKLSLEEDNISLTFEGINYARKLIGDSQNG